MENLWCGSLVQIVHFVAIADNHKILFFDKVHIFFGKFNLF